MGEPAGVGQVADVTEARRLFPATGSLAYFNTAAVGLTSSAAAEAYRSCVDDWTTYGPDWGRGEAAAESARAAAASLMGAQVADVALIASVSAAAGLVASQFADGGTGENVVIGEREYSSNHFPWRQLARKGYEVRQVPFRNGGLEPDDVAGYVDRRTRLVAFSAVQSATGHRSDVPAISSLARKVGALVFVDATQTVGASRVGRDLGLVDVLATPDHKFLMNAGRGMGYCYLSPNAQDRFVPTNAGWKAGAVPAQSFFGPTMELSQTASRFDNSISWMAAVGNEAALSVFDTFTPETIFRRNRELSDLLRSALTEIGWMPAEIPEVNRSTLVSVPLTGQEPAALVTTMKQRGVVCAARDGNLRLAVHFYNHEDDIDRVVQALSDPKGIRRA
jgi:cysteine desulfurase / selenocysteine lyase